MFAGPWIDMSIRRVLKREEALKDCVRRLAGLRKGEIQRLVTGRQYPEAVLSHCTPVKYSDMSDMQRDRSCEHSAEDSKFLWSEGQASQLVGAKGDQREPTRRPP